MGYFKDRMIQEQDQGWKYSDNLEICWRCITNQYLQDFIKSRATGKTCSFCKRTSKKTPTTIPFDDLMEVIGGAVRTHYNIVEDETIGWDPEDKCYMGETHTMEDILRDEVPPPTEKEDVLDYIIGRFDDSLYCRRNFSSLTKQEEYEFSWKEFCRIVKHDRRFLFQQIEPDPNGEGIPAKEMLAELGSVVVKHGYVKLLAGDSALYRVRIHGEDVKPTQPHELGPPPNEHSVANRMSPAGISLFYAALDDKTAYAETFTRGNKEHGTMAEWRAERELVMVDFTHEPNIPSFYAADENWERDELLFLQSFVEDITKPVELDGREHIDYVPTQIVTEYFRHAFRTEDGKPVDGILYPSARHPGGTCAVLFFGYDDIDPKWGFLEKKPVVTLVAGGVKIVTSTGNGVSKQDNAPAPTVEVKVEE